jgi:hypothetical protein
MPTAEKIRKKIGKDVKRATLGSAQQKRPAANAAGLFYHSRDL